MLEAAATLASLDLWVSERTFLVVGFSYSNILEDVYRPDSTVFSIGFGIEI